MSKTNLAQPFNQYISQVSEQATSTTFFGFAEPTDRDPKNKRCISRQSNLFVQESGKLLSDGDKRGQ